MLIELYAIIEVCVVVSIRRESNGDSYASSTSFDLIFFAKRFSHQCQSYSAYVWFTKITA